MSILETRDLTFAYSKGMPDEKLAVDGVSARFEKGEFIGIIGHTGSGKSTFIQHLNGLLRPTSGQVLFDGEDIWAHKERMREHRFKVGLVFQYPEYQLFEETIYKDIAFGPRNMRLSEEEIRARVEGACDFVGIPRDYLDRSPFDLSGGQKRRVAIAGVLAMDPQVLILDEPTAGLDPAGRDEILSEIEAYHKEKNTTVLLVSHSMEDIAKHASKVMVINEAKLYCFEPTDAVFERAEELQSLGLDIPDATAIVLELRRRGYDLPKNIYTAKYAAKMLLPLLGKGAK